MTAFLTFTERRTGWRPVHSGKSDAKRESCRLLACALFLLASGAGFLPVAQRRAPLSDQRVVLMSWDGAPQWMLQSWLSEDLPHLRWLSSQGGGAQYSQPSLPSKTAPAHAAIWTGAYGGINGILGNRILRLPYRENTILDSQSGFAAEALEAEPLWIAAARQGLPVVVVEATHDYPVAARWRDPVVSRNLTIHEGYGGILEADELIRPDEPLSPARGWKSTPEHRGGAYEFSFRMQGKEYWALFYDAPGDPTPGLDTMDLHAAKDEAALAQLKPGDSIASVAERFARVPVVTAHGTALCYFRLFSLSPDGSTFLLYRTPIVFERGEPQSAVLASREFSGGFIGQGADTYYRGGNLGTTIPSGGNGQAEQRYLETILMVNRQISKMTTWYMKNRPWRLLITYSPYPDEALHQWTGWLDPSSRAYRPDIARQLRPFVLAMLRSLDELLGAIRENLKEGDTLILTSDHGMRGVTRYFYPNKLLKDAGHLGVTPEGEIDLRRTRAYYPERLNSGYIVINSHRFKSGVVSEGDWSFVVKNIVRLLKRATDPATGKSIVRDVIDPTEFGGRPEVGPIRKDFIFFDLEKDYDYGTPYEVSSIVGDREPYGTHVFFPSNPDMRAIFFIIGPGVRAGKTFDDIRHIDIAPTVAQILGIAPPAQAMGRPIK